ncbi:MAG: arginine--tRNA ligase [Chloroflexota bacterium]|nr:MAG: arginine--tRNA ligase [Chloroflexota bacterium]
MPRGTGRRPRVAVRPARVRWRPQFARSPSLSDAQTAEPAPTLDDGGPTLRSAARSAVRRAWDLAASDGALPGSSATVDVAVDVERPASPDHGDLATNLALRLARPLGLAPRVIAEAIAARMGPGSSSGSTLIESATVAGPGFINLRFTDAALERGLGAALAAPMSWGRVASGGRARHVNVEFVSANPTGPLTIGNARGAFAGDLLCRVLEAGGQQVTREYYFNDSGAQVRNLGASVLALREGREVPEDGYHGDYVADLARAIPAEALAPAGATDEDAAWSAGRWASEQIRAGIEASLGTLGVHFDVWKTEGSLHAEGWVERAIERLRGSGHLYEQDGALWFRSTSFGDDKDRVVIRSNGEPTYFASDLGYVTEKFSRGFDHLIYIWGADHHGTVARVRNAAEAMGFDKAAVEMILTGWVRFVRDGVEVSMSKRAGNFVTLDELLSEIGVDAARWFFASRGANMNIDFDIELAKKQSSENPVYYVQYAHARIASILRKAREVGLAAATDLGGVAADGPDGALARVVVRYPEVVEDAAAAQETQGVTTYATDLATAFHAFYRDAKVVDAADPVTSGRRIALVEATRVTLANALGLLGISAPDSM